MTDVLPEVWIVQPYVPAYRVAFFTRLRAQLLRDGCRSWPVCRRRIKPHEVTRLRWTGRPPLDPGPSVSADVRFL